MSRYSASNTSTVLKVMAIIAVFSFLSTLPMAPISKENLARIAAAPSPFGPPIMVNDNQAGEQTAPIVTAFIGNELFAVWQDSRSCNAIYSSRSYNNGTTFAPNIRIDDPIFNSSRPLQPSVAVSRNGTLLVTWQDNRRNTFDYDIFFAKSYNGGVTFKKNVKVDDSKSSPVSWQERPAIATTLGGTIFIAWTDDRSGAMRIRGAYSTDMGATFSPSSEIGPAGTSGQNEVDLVANGNRIFAAFVSNATGVNHPYVCSSTNGGKTFTTPTRLDDTGIPGKAQNGVSIAPMPTGGVVATWADSRNGDSDIYASIVSTDCTILTSNIRVDNDSTYNYNWQQAAAVATDQLGNVYAAWEDERTSGYPAVRFAVLKAGAIAFAASMEVARPGSTDMQLRPSITAKDPGHVFVAWQDVKAGTSDVYVASGYIPNLFDLALFGGWNFVSLFLANSTLKASTLGLKKGDTVVQWNMTRGVYDLQYIVGISSPASDFFIKPSTGYWIYAKAAETISFNGTIPTSKQSRVIAGPGAGCWATVGFLSFNSTRRASDIPAMYSVAGGVTAVTSYNPTNGRYSTYIVGVPSSDFKVVPGQAYWCWFTAGGVLTYSP